MPDHIRLALDAISRGLEPTRRLASMHVPMTPGRLPARIAARRDWLLLADGRPALRATRRLD